MTLSELRRTAFTFCVALGGGAAFHLINLPVAWLSGSMLAVAVLVMMDGPAHMPQRLRDLGLLTAGISLGSTITPDALAGVQRYPLSLIGLLVTVAVTVFTSGYILQRVFGWDRATALLSSVPGALSAVMSTAIDCGADVRRIAVVQSIRLFVMILIVPLAIKSFHVAAPVAEHAKVGLPGLALTFALAILLALAFVRVGMTSAVFLAGMITGGALHLTDVVPGQVPEWLLIAGMVLVGMFAGMRFAGTSLSDLVTMINPGLVSLVVTLGFAVVGAGLVYLGTGLRAAEVLVAFAPGGAEAMIVMGAVMGLDTLYISTHHILRVVMLSVATPFLLKPKGEISQ